MTSQTACNAGHCPAAVAEAGDRPVHGWNTLQMAVGHTSPLELEGSLQFLEEHLLQNDQVFSGFSRCLFCFPSRNIDGRAAHLRAPKVCREITIC